MERVLSRISVKSEEDDEEEKKQTLDAEERAKGTLKWSVIANYIKSVESVWAVAMALFALLLTQAAATTADYWLSFWYENMITCYIKLFSCRHSLPHLALPF